MDFELFYWHWLLLGMILMIAEIFMPSFTILWFGLGALVVGLVLVFIDISFTAQLVLWTVSSVIFTVFWFQFFKRNMSDKTSASSAREAVIGEFGQVIKLPTENSRGKVRFVTPILGDDEWDFISKDKVEIGDRVHISEISGNTLIVVKYNKEAPAE